MTTRYLTTDQNGNGDQTYWDINGYFLHGPSGEKLNLGGGNTTVTASNEIVQIGTSYIRIPQGVSNERPNPSYAGMIRYLTSENLIEYYKNDIGEWIPISQQPPTITSINPDFVSSGATGQSINVFGTNFKTGTSVSFIGQDLTIYNSGITTSFINENQLSATVPSSVTDNSSNDPYSVKVTNPSGLSEILSNSLNINERPVFTTLQNPNIYATVDACFNVQPQMDLSASDFGNHFPLTYDECGNILSTKNLTLELSGAIVGIPPLPSLYTALSYSEIFNAIVTDSSSAVSLPGEFKFVVQRPINNFTQTGGTVTYADTVNGVANNTSSTTPYMNGSVIIKYTNTSGTHNFIPSFPTPVPVQTMIVGGGGGGGTNIAGGGGAGGVIITEILTQNTSFSGISVGSGGAGGTAGAENNGIAGNNTTLTFGSTTLTGNGGGYGGKGGGSAEEGGPGGSGGGGGGWSGSFHVGGASNQGDGGIGYSGGRGSGTGNTDEEGGGGGGGAGFYGEQFKQIGSSGGASSRVAGAGGIGIISNIDGTNKYYAGGGGGGYYGTPYSSFGYVSGLGGQGGGGNGGTGLGGAGTAGSDATSNSGSGGGGSSGYIPGTTLPQKGGDGGSGIVILRFPYVSQVYRPALNELIINDISNASINIIYTDNTANGGAVQTSPVAGGYTIYEFICGPNTDTTSPSFNGLITFTPNNDLSNVDFLVVAGGGGGHGRNGAGGGAGGLRTSFATAEGTSGGGGSYQSTLDFSANNNYNVVIGNGGGNYYSGTVSSTTGGPSISTASYNGGNSSLQYNAGTISCTGGGGGTGFSNPFLPGSSGGSGGGGGGCDAPGTGNVKNTGGAGTTNEGYAGGDGNQNNTTNGGGGGGGAAGPGAVASGSGTTGYGGNGGAAINSYIKGNSGFVVAGGGGGGWGGSGSSPPNATSGGTPPTAINGNQQGGGSSGVTVGGRGGFGGNTASDCIFPTNPTPHTGSGGAGGGQVFGTSGSSGVVCIRFPSFA